MNIRKLMIILLMLVLMVAAGSVMAQETIDIGDTVEGTLVAGERVDYTFTADEGDIISIDMRADFDAYLYLLDADGTELTRDDDGGEGTNSLIRGFVIPADGTYTIQAAGFGDRGDGSFTLALREFDAIFAAVGETVMAEFDGDISELTFVIMAEIGQVLDIVVDSGNLLDTRMDVIHPFGYNVASNDDAPGTVDPALEAVSIDTEGQYIISITASNPNATLVGSFELTITEAALVSLDDGPVDLSFDFDSFETIVVFEGMAGETITLTVTLEDISGFASPYFELRQSGEQIGNFNTRGVDSITVSFEIPEDGEIRLSVQSYSQMNISIALGRELE